MGWTEWKRYKRIKMCPDCGYSKGICRRKYIILGKVLKIKISCDDCKDIAAGKKKKRSPVSLKERQIQVSNMNKKGKDKVGRKRTQRDDVKEMRTFRRKKKKESTDRQLQIKYLEEK